MDRKFFNQKRELKLLFQQSAQESGSTGLEADEREERKEMGRGNNMEPNFDGASRK
jgi:hypothetical protein